MAVEVIGKREIPVRFTVKRENLKPMQPSLFDWQFPEARSGGGAMNVVHMPTELLSGVAEMDDQHDRLFNEIVQVKCALLEVVNDHTDGLALLSGFAKDLVAHFAWEEAAAKAEGIPFEESHIKEHRRISTFIRAKVGEVSRGECNIPALMVFMERYFENHVVQYDLKLGHDLQAAHVPR
ncbi:MAG: hypothetical protein WBO95_03900 [Candidatus Dechloromonas phosphoritropha]|jgi:hemerythrin-like metal-binding protein